VASQADRGKDIGHFFGAMQMTAASTKTNSRNRSMTEFKFSEKPNPRRKPTAR
jgi:hypothetical protein